MRHIRQYFLDQLAEQSAESERHLADSYWTDGRTCRNIGLDERQVVSAMRLINLEPSDEESADPERYRAHLLAELDAVAENFRINAPDPDGYGIATIGTVARNLAQFKG